MISRRSAMEIANAYHTCFTYTERSHRTTTFRYYKDRLYDFLFVWDGRPWLMNALRAIRTTDSRGLKDFILKLHTGESTTIATDGWPWAQRRRLGHEVLLELAEALITERTDSETFETYGSTKRDAVDRMRRALELDGYIYRSGRLQAPEESLVDEAEEQGVLESLATSLELSSTQTLQHHLGLAAQHYLEERWDDSISNSRKVLEWVLSAAADKLRSAADGPKVDLSRPSNVRDYLEAGGLLDKKEKDAIGKVYGLLSETGSHPYVAAKDQARLTRHLALTLSQFVLLRLRGATAGPAS